MIHLLWKKSLRVPRTKQSYDPAIFIYIYTLKNWNRNSNKYMYEHVHSSSVFTGWMYKQVWYWYFRKYYLHIKNEILTDVTVWMSLKNMLSEINQILKVTHYDSIYMKYPETQSEDWWLRGSGKDLGSNCLMGAVFF